MPGVAVAVRISVKFGPAEFGVRATSTLNKPILK